MGLHAKKKGDSVKVKGQAIFFALIGLLFFVFFFGAVAPIMQNTINSVGPTQTVTTQSAMAMILPGLVIAGLVAFYYAITPK